MDRNDKLIDLNISVALCANCQRLKIYTLGKLLDTPNDYLYKHFSHKMVGEVDDLRYDYEKEMNERYGK